MVWMELSERYCAWRSHRNITKYGHSFTVCHVRRACPVSPIMNEHMQSVIDCSSDKIYNEQKDWPWCILEFKKRVPSPSKWPTGRKALATVLSMYYNFWLAWEARQLQDVFIKSFCDVYCESQLPKSNQTSLFPFSLVSRRSPVSLQGLFRWPRNFRVLNLLSVGVFALQIKFIVWWYKKFQQLNPKNRWVVR